MKKFLLIITFALCNFLIANAQDENTDRKAEKIQALKIAFITEKLSLTSEEAQRFWPVYGQYENEMKSLQNEKRNGDVLDNEEKQLNIRKKYKSEFINIIGQPRMNKLFNSEREFRGALLQRLRNNNQQRLLRPNR